MPRLADGARGLRTADQRSHSFQTTICALGAYGASLVPELGVFNVARCWSVAHVQLSAQECDVLRGIPIVNVRDLGFFFEPDPHTRLLKMTPLGAGYSNFDGSTTSLPPLDEKGSEQDAQSLSGYVPREDEAKMRLLLRETLPWLAKRPFVAKKMCWFTDTVDSEYCVDFLPGSEGSVVVLSGDSGHGFKMMPGFGKWVGELLVKGRQERKRWAWNGDKDENSGSEDWGSSVAWRFGEVKEIKEVVMERKRVRRARL